MTLFIAAQIGIGLFGVTGIWLANGKSAWQRKWAPIVGLLGQPFWFISAYLAAQWVILAMTLLYTAAWMRGLYHQWIKD